MVDESGNLFEQCLIVDLLDGETVWFVVYE